RAAQRGAMGMGGSGRHAGSSLSCSAAGAGHGASPEAPLPAEGPPDSRPVPGWRIRSLIRRVSAAVLVAVVQLGGLLSWVFRRPAKVPLASFRILLLGAGDFRPGRSR